MNSEFPIIIVDDETNVRIAVKGALEVAGFRNTSMCESVEGLPDLLKENGPAVILLDLNMPEKSGQELLPELKRDYPECEVIVFTGMDDVETAVSCIKEGAFDYLVKPFDPLVFPNIIRHAVDMCTLRNRMHNINESLLKKPLKNPEAFSGIITQDSTVLNVFSYCEAIANGNEPILITGETGVGKELIAEVLHELSGRSGKFVTLNIAGLDEKMFNSTLFGHAKGAFTGAVDSQKGLVEEAEGGTLFLDEIGDLSIENQIKLLRLLEKQEFYPIGSNKVKTANTHIVLATNIDLDKQLEKGKFRKDLYYRITTHLIHLPPLRERMGDLVPLVHFFLKEAAEKFNKKVPTYPPELIILLKTYHFPGNIRELRSMVFDAISTHDSRKLSMQTFRKKIRKARKRAYPKKNANFEVVFPDVLPSIKKCTELLVAEALKRASQNQKIAAESLGVTQQALNKRLMRKSKFS